MGKNFDWKRYSFDVGKDLFGVLAVSLSLLLMDGRLYLFIISLAMCLVIAIGLSVYRYKKSEVILKENKRLGMVAKFGLVLTNSLTMGNAIKQMEEQGYENDKLLLALKNGQDVSSFGKSGSLLGAMVEAFKNGVKSEINSFIQEALNEKNNNQSLIDGVASERSIGIAMACIAAIPLVLFPQITVVKEAMVNNDWLGLLLRLVILFLFVMVEFLGSNFNQKKEGE